MNVLVAEDNPAVARLLRQACEEAGYTLQVVGDGVSALDRAREGNFDLILLDVMLPNLNGFEVCRRLRASQVASLILIITARDTLEDKIEGLDAGADDYLVKPFEVAELLARMRALLRRSMAPPFVAPTVLRVDDLALDTAAHQAERGGQRVHLSATEYALLEFLMRHSGRVCTRTAILDHVWQYDFNGNDNVVDVYISYLRNKIDRGRTPLIHTVRGIGFRMSDAP